MAKSPGFWFFTGDWMKDPELRFCSIFARGLLVDLLCILHEAKEQGYASNPDGSPRSDEQIVDAISGGAREDKLAGLAELERSGVLSRDNRGVLFSRRVARLADLSNSRKQNGSKGGSKTSSKRAANHVANLQQTEQQNRGVSVSVSDSVSDSFKEEIHTHTQGGGDFRQPGWAADEWQRFVAVWNVTERAERWPHLTAPDGWADRAASPGWLQRAGEALAMLPSRAYFERPLPVTRFFDFVDRIRAGEFADPKVQHQARGRSRQPAGGNL